MRLTLIVSVLFFIQLFIYSQTTEFFQEYITIEIYGEYVEINGIYQFKNPGNSYQETKLFYPFPADSMYKEVSDVYAFETFGNNSVNKLITTSTNGALVELGIDSNSEKTIYIGYKQKLLGNKAEYILTSTRKWHKPLESSQIELILPHNIKVDSISYQTERPVAYGEKVHFFFQKHNFSPKKNFVVWFNKN